MVLTYKTLYGTTPVYIGIVGNSLFKSHPVRQYMIKTIKNNKYHISMNRPLKLSYERLYL